MPGLGEMNSVYGLITYGLFGILSILLVLTYIKNNNVEFNLCNKFVVVFFIICLISGVYGCINENQISDFIRGIIPFCWYCYIIVFSSEKYNLEYNKIINFLGIIASVYSLRIIVYYIIFVMLGDSTRVTLNLSTATSPVTIVGILIFTYLFIFNKNKYRKLYFAGIILCYFAMNLTITKSMIIATILGIIVLLSLIVFILTKIKAEKKILKQGIKDILIIIMALIVVTGIVYMTTNMAQRWESAAQAVVSNESDGSVAPRLIEYSVAYENWKESPVLGKGLGFRWHSDKLPYANGVIFMHNIIAYLLLDFGIVGIIYITSVIIMLVSLLFTTIRKSNYMVNLNSLGMVSLSFAIISMLFIYANFFAVFRNIDFTIICALFISIIVSVSRNIKSNSEI